MSSFPNELLMGNILYSLCCSTCIILPFIMVIGITFIVNLIMKKDLDDKKKKIFTIIYAVCAIPIISILICNVASYFLAIKLQ